MKLNISAKNIFRIKLIIWVLYGIYLLIAFITIKNVGILLGICLSGVLIYFTIVSFLNNWYKLGIPRLLDWFRLGTFFTLIINFLSIAFLLDQKGTILVNNSVSVSADNALLVLFVIFIGLIGLKTGEIFFNKKTPYREVEKYLKLRHNFILYGLTVLVSFTQLFLLLNGYIGYGSEVNYNFSRYSFLLQIIGIVAPFLMVLLSIGRYYLIKNSLFYKLLFSGFLSLQLLVGFLSGMKENIIVPVILVAVPYILSGKKVSKLLIAATAVAMLIIYPINNSYREILNNSKLNKSTALSLAAANTFNFNLSQIISSGGESYSSRLSLFPTALYSIDLESKWDEYKYLDRYTLLPFAWIVPRSILPNKPASDTGSIFYKSITGRTTSSVTPSTFGWAYLEGGIIPVFLSFFIFGIVVGLIENKINILSVYGTIIYALLFANLIKIESDIYFRLTGIFQTLLISFLLYKFFISKNSAEREFI